MKRIQKYINKFRQPLPDVICNILDYNKYNNGGCVICWDRILFTIIVVTLLVVLYYE